MGGVAEDGGEGGGGRGVPLDPHSKISLVGFTIRTTFLFLCGCMCSQFPPHNIDNLSSVNHDVKLSNGIVFVLFVSLLNV